MALIDRLGYEVKPANAAQRLVWELASSRPGSWVFSRTLHHVDKLMLRISRGRVTLTGALAGLPLITLTTTGARSGLPREMPLLGVPIDGSIAVIGTRFGQQHTPAWYFNLVANPEAEVAYRDRRARVKAREATGDERDVIWTKGRSLYAGYDASARRIAGRDIHIMVLDEIT